MREATTVLKTAVSGSVSGLPRAFWWLFASTLVNRLGAFVSTFLALYLTVERGYSSTYAGALAALYGLGGVIASLGSGVMADRIGRRPTLFLSHLLTAPSVAALGFVEHPAAIAGATFVVGMTSNASRPAVQAMLTDIVAPKDRERAFALNYWAFNLGFAVSTTLAGLVAEHGFRTLFLAEAVMMAVCAVLVFLRVAETRPAKRPGTVPGEAAEVSLSSVLRNGRFMTLVLLSFLVTTLLMQGSVALPVTMGRSGLSSADFGVAIAANGVLVVLLQIPVTRLIEHRNPAWLLALASLFAGYGCALTALADSVAAYALTVAVWTIGEIINSPIQMGLVARMSPEQGRGRYQGVYVTSVVSASLTAPLVSGYAIDRFGSDALWLSCAVVGTLVAAAYVLCLRQAPERTALPDAP
ncbi:MFS transporter [Streptomyces sp. NPDC041003]|uniref:MDR family MFS transporter n=1 Tax=Streptomyces sp. NPDC041003 TaxID=3155730 RepID=UPI0033DC1B4D